MLVGLPGLVSPNQGDDVLRPVITIGVGRGRLVPNFPDDPLQASQFVDKMLINQVILIAESPSVAGVTISGGCRGLH